MVSAPDPTLAEYGVSGDSFARVVTATEAELRSYIAGLGVSPADVDDIAQEAYLRWYRAPDRRPDEVEPIRWLKGIARHAALDHFRRLAQRGDALRELAAVLEHRAAEAAERAPAALDALKRCLESLPEDDRQLIARHYAESDAGDIGTAAIAAAVGRSVDAVRRALRRARHALKECVERRLAGSGR